MSKRVKQYLMLLAAVGVLAVALGGGGGTFASFNAVVTNQNNVFATGTLFLHEKNDSGTCTSEAIAANLNNVDCGVLFNYTNQLENTPQTATIALSNAGSLNAGDLELKVTCADARPTIATVGAYSAFAAAGTGSLSLSNLHQTLVDGTDLLINGTDFVVQTTVSPDGSNNATVSVKATQSAAATTGSSNVALAAFGDALCSAGGAQVKVQEVNARTSPTDEWCTSGGATGSCAWEDFSTLTSAYADYTSLLNNLWTGGPAGSGFLDAGKTRYFSVSVQVPDSLGNAAQNSQVKFDLDWKITQ